MIQLKNLIFRHQNYKINNKITKSLIDLYFKYQIIVI